MKMSVRFNEKDREFSLGEPSQSQIFELDKFYRKVFSECIREGIMTEAEAKKRFEESGAWTKSDESEIQKLMNLVAFDSAMLSQREDLDDDTADLIEKIQQNRSSLFELISRKTELLSNTAEGMSNEQKVFQYMLLCLRDEDGKRVFLSKEEIEEFSKTNPEELSVLAENAYAKVYGIEEDRDITEDWAEVRFMSKMSDKQEEKEEESSESDNS